MVAQNKKRESKTKYALKRRGNLEINTFKLMFMNPIRWVYFLVYIFGPFFWYMTKANLDVAYRVITGKINPGIVKIKTGLKTDLGITMLANSITLTPGTLSVDIDEQNNDLYIHCLNITDKNLIINQTIDEEQALDQICGSMIKWVKRITE